ncbi:MAG: hypothetical protein FWE02_05170 [Defluviitaleaceae bacterium]|nr:hypothetical protein [Defluviitaleaceae bacterium]
MANNLEIKERHRQWLSSLLRIKKKNPGSEMAGLQDEIEIVVSIMEQEDVAWVEKITDVKAID